MKKLRLVCAFTLALILALTATVSLAADPIMAPPPVHTTDLPFTTEPVTLTVFAAQQAICEDLRTNYATKWLEEQTGITIDWQAVPAGEAAEKLNVLINSGSELPDVIITNNVINNTSKYIYGAQGLFLPMNDLIEKYGVETKALWAYNPALQAQMTSPDGNIYALGSYVEITHTQYNKGLWMNDTWLKNLGLERPNTLDELYDVLVAFRDNDPNGNGIKDEIPITGADEWYISGLFNYVVNAFIYYGDERFNVTDGKITTVLDTEAYREALRYMKKLWDADLLDKQMFSQKEEQMRQNIMGDVVKAGMVSGDIPIRFADNSGEQTKMYNIMSPVAGPEGVRYSEWYPPSFSGNNYIITKDCKNPELAFRMGDFICSQQANAVAYLGEEGVDWRWGEEGELGIDGLPAYVAQLNSLPSMASQNKGWMWMGSQIDLRFMDGSVFDPETDPWYIEYRLYRDCHEYLEPYRPTEGPVPNLTFIEEEAQVDAQYGTEFDIYRKTARTQFVIGELDLDADWDSYVETLNALGMNELRDIRVASYDRLMSAAQ